MKVINFLGGFSAKALVLVGAIACLSLSTDLAMAKDHIGKSHGHEREFYALANVGEAVDHTAAVHHSNCFMTSTPAEAARGIRHWTGSC